MNGVRVLGYCLFSGVNYIVDFDLNQSAQDRIMFTPNKGVFYMYALKTEK